MAPPAIATETAPLLPPSSHPRRKRFYRARPLWLAPFAITAAIVRGMTLAPRVEVFTQISCNRLHGRQDWNHTQHDLSLSNSSFHTTLSMVIDPLSPHLPIILPTTNDDIFLNSTLPKPGSTESWKTDDPTHLPLKRCAADPSVLAGAARLQAVTTTTMGLLSALSTGWWGHFGERHGRTVVLAIATLGLFLTDLVFIMVSTPGTVFARHGHFLIYMTPIFEGLLGGWSSLQSATSAYLSDCTSAGSRANIFSRFTGVFYLGFSVGPSLTGWLLQHPPFPRASTTLLPVFCIASFASFLNLFFSFVVLPESLGKNGRKNTISDPKGKRRAIRAPISSIVEAGELSPVVDPDGEDLTGTDAKSHGNTSFIRQLFSPLAVFLPAAVPDPYGLGRKKEDWSLTILAIAIFGYMLSTGIYQIKYLYATHIYGWAAETLSYYISLMGGMRAIHLLVLLPTFISLFKPIGPPSQTIQRSKNPTSNLKADQTQTIGSSSLASSIPPAKKVKPSRVQLGKEISFDLTLARFSLMLDIISHSLVVVLPIPKYKAHISQPTEIEIAKMPKHKRMSYSQSQAAFILATSLSSFGSGVVPTMHSLALCLLQVREVDAKGVGAPDRDGSVSASEGIGGLFGALAVLQAVGQSIIGPMLLGLIYSETVSQSPTAIFMAAAAICIFSLVLLLSIQNPVRAAYPGRRQGVKRREDREVQRGRSRISKDLRGGAVAYYPTPSSSTYKTISAQHADSAGDHV